MKLAAWRKQQGWTQERLGRELGVRQAYISTLERARDPAVPGPALMIEIYTLTRGAVTPLDFYELPALEREAIPA